VHANHKKGMLRAVLAAILAYTAGARLLHKSNAKMRVAQVPVPVQIPLQIPMLVPIGGPMTGADFFSAMPSMQSMSFDGPGLPDMEMTTPFGGFMAAPGFQPPAFQVTPEQLMKSKDGTQHNEVAESSSTSVSREQTVETLRNGTKQLRTVETRCKNGKCHKKELVKLIKPTNMQNAEVNSAAQSEKKTVPAANVGPSTTDAVEFGATGPPSIEDVLHQVMGFGRDIGNMELRNQMDGMPRFPFAAEGLKIRMPKGPNAVEAPLSLQHLDGQDEIVGTLPSKMNATDLKVDQSGHVVTVQYRMKDGQSTVGVEQRFSLDFTPPQKPKAKYNRANGKFSVVIARPKNVQKSSSDVEIVMDDEAQPVVPAKQATHIHKSKKHVQKQQTEEMQKVKKHLEAALDPKAEPIIMLEFSS